MNTKSRPHGATWQTKLAVALLMGTAAAGGATLLGCTAARADSDSPPSAPRVSSESGPLGVVLIVSNGKLLGFVDRVEDNGLVDDATLSVTPEKGQAIAMERAGPGLLTTAWEAKLAATPLHVHVTSATLAAAADLDVVLPGTQATDAPTPAPAAEPSRWMEQAGLGGAALLLATALVWLRLSSRRGRKLPRSAQPQI